MIVEALIQCVCTHKYTLALHLNWKTCHSPAQVISDIVKSNYSSEEGAAKATPTDMPTNTQAVLTSAVSSSTVREGELPGKPGAVEKTECECEGSSASDGGSVRDPDCTECGLVHPDPTPDQLVMYLHALRYTVSCGK